MIFDLPLCHGASVTGQPGRIFYDPKHIVLNCGPDLPQGEERKSGKCKVQEFLESFARWRHWSHSMWPSPNYFGFMYTVYCSICVVVEAGRMTLSTRHTASSKSNCYAIAALMFHYIYAVSVCLSWHYIAEKLINAVSRRSLSHWITRTHRQ